MKGNRPKLFLAAAAMIGIIGLAILAFFPGTWLHLREPRYEGKPLNHWVDQLYSESPSNELAETAIRSIGPKGVPFLLRRDRHEYWFYRKIWDGLPLEFQQLLPQPNIDAYKRVMSKITRALDLIGPPALPYLIKALRDRDENVQWLAIHRVASLGKDDDTAVLALSQLLRHPKPEIRRQVAIALSNGGLRPKHRLAIPALIGVLSDADGGVRSVAALVLGQFGREAQAAVSALTNLLKDPHAYVRHQAAVALWKINADPAVIPFLIKELEILALNQRPGDLTSFSQLLNALAEMGPAAKSATPVILKLVESPSASWPEDQRADILKNARATLRQIDPGSVAAPDPPSK